jgi:hypothetical protein
MFLVDFVFLVFSLVAIVLVILLRQVLRQILGRMWFFGVTGQGAIEGWFSRISDGGFGLMHKSGLV